MILSVVVAIPSTSSTHTTAYVVGEEWRVECHVAKRLERGSSGSEEGEMLPAFQPQASSFR